MFVRWKVRKRKGRGFERPGDTFYCVLVKAVRVAGEPRQRHVANLGSIRRDDAEHSYHCLERAAFWKQVGERLSQLRLPCRAKIENEIGAMVPRPDRAEIRRDKARIADRLAKLGGFVVP